MKRVIIFTLITLLLSIYSNTEAGWTEMYEERLIEFLDIWGSSNSDIFAVGFTYPYNYPENTGIILHYDGSTWSIMESGISQLWEIWGSSATNVFAIGYNYNTNGDTSVILHYDGSTWSTMESSTEIFFNDIWGSSGSDVFVVGNGSIIHYDGSGWSTMEGVTGAKGVWGSSGSDVFTFGSSYFHYDGTTWTEMETGIATEDFHPLDIWGSSATDVYVVGGGPGLYFFEKPRIIHYDGSGWSEVYRDMEGPYDGRYTGVWGSSATNVFVTESGEDFPSMSPYGGIINSDGTNWPGIYTSLTPLNRVWGLSSSDVFAVGGGSIYRYDGIPEDEDNCPDDYNPEQTDSDGDCIGDLCDEFPEIYDPTQLDSDSDGVSDVCDADDDNDSVLDANDNCPLVANTSQEDGDTDSIGDACDNCLEVPNPDQEDTYPPPSGNGIGDACDCECDFDCNGGVDATDVTLFLNDFGRRIFNNPCTNASPCNGDANCNGNVDAFDVTMFLQDFGRSYFNNPCPACVVEDWCNYQSTYLIDDIAGDGGKNFPMPQSITVNIGSIACVDLYLTNVDVPQNAGGAYLDFTGSTAHISYVSGARCYTNGGEGCIGPWTCCRGAFLNEPAGVGTLLMVMEDLGGASPDGDGDLMIGRFCLRHDSINDATVNITTVPGVATWTPIDDEDIIPGSFVIRQ